MAGQDFEGDSHDVPVDMEDAAPTSSKKGSQKGSGTSASRSKGFDRTNKVMLHNAHSMHIHIPQDDQSSAAPAAAGGFGPWPCPRIKAASVRLRGVVTDHRERTGAEEGRLQHVRPVLLTARRMRTCLLTQVEEKGSKLPGAGWQKVAKGGGHYSYVSPDGMTFSSRSAGASPRYQGKRAWHAGMHVLRPTMLWGAVGCCGLEA